MSGSLRSTTATWILFFVASSMAAPTLTAVSVSKPRSFTLSAREVKKLLVVVNQQDCGTIFSSISHLPGCCRINLSILRGRAIHPVGFHLSRYRVLVAPRRFRMTPSVLPSQDAAGRHGQDQDLEAADDREDPVLATDVAGNNTR